MGIDVKERQKHHLNVLLKLKRENADTVVKGLQQAIETAVAVMEQGDVAWVEKIVGISAL